MGAHIVDGLFQSDKYPTCPPGKVPLSVKDSKAQDLLWEYAARRESVDAEFSADLRQALITAGYVPPPKRRHVIIFRHFAEDIEALKRSLVHLLPLPADRLPRCVGESLVLVAQEKALQGYAAHISAITRVGLKSSLTEADLPLLNALSLEDYGARWDRLYPNQPIDSDPLVDRVEFTYALQTVTVAPAPAPDPFALAY